MTRNILLIVGMVIGVCVAGPYVAGFASVWWWLSAPVIVVYIFWLWRWGVAWLADDDRFASASVWVKIGGVLIMLGYTFIGIALLVFAAMLAAQYWGELIVALLVVGAFIAWYWISNLIDKARKRAAAAAAAPAALNEPPKPDDIVR